MKKKTKLVLENGIIFSGNSLGAFGETIGEICFNTGMTGYQEILTDPSYCGQIITMTYPHIGNYGINNDDVESNNVHASGFVIKEETLYPSNYKSIQSIGEYLKKKKIIGIQNIDTRMLTRIIRNEGAMNAIISNKDLNKKTLLKKVQSASKINGADLAKVVTTKQSYDWCENKTNYFKIAAIDFGIKHNIIKQLVKNKCNVKIFPANVSYQEIIKYNPDGVFLSNGPGDPSAVNYAIKTVKKLIGIKPIFGICLGHQILALALGGKTYKLKFGHRGCNHPVKNLQTNKTEITSQNHGFSVDPQSLNNNIEITHISLNDNTVEGLQCKEKQLFSVQFHPESSPGPHDSRYLFNQFIKMMTKKIHA